ncbi:MAG TPA: DALR domain-containing protein, partial [Chitinophagaceae bacterium]
YRSTLDFSNEALQAAEKGLQRLLEATDLLQKLRHPGDDNASFKEDMDKEITGKCALFAEYMNDDFNSARVIANFFELVPVVNSFKGGQLPIPSIKASTFELLRKTWNGFLFDVLGLKEEKGTDSGKIDGVLQLLVDIRREARGRKDYATSDKIRNQLQSLGIALKDEKDGSISWTIL